MENKFHSELNRYIKNHDSENASKVIFNELALALLKDRENFIEVLRNAGISTFDGSSDLQLIDLFVKNAPNNKKLLLGASLLINHRNKTLNFDGDAELNDGGVKNSYYEMDEFFNGREKNSNAIGAIAGALGAGANLASGIMSRKHEQNTGASTALSKQIEARKQMIQTIIDQKKQKADEKAKEKAHKRKVIIIGSSIAGAVVLGTLIYFLVKKNKK